MEMHDLGKDLTNICYASFIPFFNVIFYTSSGISEYYKITQ